MQIANCKDHVLRFGEAPTTCSTSLVLGFERLASPSRVDSLKVAVVSSSSASAIVRPQPMAAASMSFGVPSLASLGCLDGVARQSSPVQLELLPLHPTSQREPLCSTVPAFVWPQPSVASYSTAQVLRGIDVNQIPSSADCDDAADSSPSGVFSHISVAEPLRGSDIGLSMKREREKLSDVEPERTCEVSSRGSDEEECGGTRKKLRLSKEQSALLEESFKEHSTLNPKQKNALAKQLNLRPRQVEVWFQNRRARTKLKQTEVDCELLKKCCEALTEENRRLQKELQELRAIKVAPPCVIAHDFYMPLPAATLTMCPSCERLGTLDNRTLGFGKPQLPHQISQPSAAC